MSLVAGKCVFREGVMMGFLVLFTHWLSVRVTMRCETNDCSHGRRPQAQARTTPRTSAVVRWSVPGI